MRNTGFVAEFAARGGVSEYFRAPDLDIHALVENGTFGEWRPRLLARARPILGKEAGVKDSNFLKENNARYLWHPMGHPRDARETPRQSSRRLPGSESATLTGMKRSTRSAVSGTSISGFHANRSRPQSRINSPGSRTTPASWAPRMTRRWNSPMNFRNGSGPREWPGRFLPPEVRIRLKPAFDWPGSTTSHAENPANQVRLAQERVSWNSFRRCFRQWKQPLPYRV